MESPSVRIESIFNGRNEFVMKRIRESLRLKSMIFSIFLATIPLTIAVFSVIEICQQDS
jgi:hypothetical protein